jgi:hypothetical protein
MIPPWQGKLVFGGQHSPVRAWPERGTSSIRAKFPISAVAYEKD